MSDIKFTLLLLKTSGKALGTFYVYLPRAENSLGLVSSLTGLDSVVLVYKRQHIFLFRLFIFKQTLPSYTWVTNIHGPDPSHIFMFVRTQSYQTREQLNVDTSLTKCVCSIPWQTIAKFDKQIGS